jgi:hypothetical protein
MSLLTRVLGRLDSTAGNLVLHSKSRPLFSSSPGFFLQREVCAMGTEGVQVRGRLIEDQGRGG